MRTAHVNRDSTGSKSIKALCDFVNAIPRDERKQFAIQCSTTLGHLLNVMYGAKSCSAKLAVLIERHSDGAVNRFVLRSEDWHEIWPELVGSTGAPDVPARSEGVAA